MIQKTKSKDEEAFQSQMNSKKEVDAVKGQTESNKTG